MADELQAELDRLRVQVTTLTTERDEARTQLETRTGELRSVRHKAAFKDKAIAAGVRPKAVDALWALEGYEPETDEADPAALDELLARSRESHDYLFEAAQAEGAREDASEAQEATAADEATKPAPKAPAKPQGAQRGRPPMLPGRFRVTKAQTQDFAWIVANRAKYDQAVKDGTLQLVD